MDILENSLYQSNFIDMTKFGYKPTSFLSRPIYDALSKDIVRAHHQMNGVDFLKEKLKSVNNLRTDLPVNHHLLSTFIKENTKSVGDAYKAYLLNRKNGMPRQYFTNKSHALNFLRAVAPTKLADGSWLYGFLKGWKTCSHSALIKIYLEELGEGDPNKNHVLLFRKLILDNGCNDWGALDDDYFTQGAIQLALGRNVEQFLPEVIGFNFGYEQLPLHLLITAYELKELKIDPYYFTLHLTVDNASTGHAHDALQSLYDALPLQDAEAFYERFKNGYKLNQLGICSEKIINSFDIDEELISILKAKSVYGQNMHSDICKIGGKTMNEWLSNEQDIPQLLDILVQEGWIKRNQNPSESRFWKLIEGNKSKMFGVFSDYEKQVIYDWIVNQNSDVKAYMSPQNLEVDGIDFNLQNFLKDSNLAGDFDSDISSYENKIASLKNKDQIMAYLITLMSPALHHSPIGLAATRLYRAILYKNSISSNTPSEFKVQ